MTHTADNTDRQEPHMPFDATNWTSVWIWPTPAEGQLVPDFPPTDLTPYIADIQVEQSGSVGGTTTSSEEQA